MDASVQAALWGGTIAAIVSVIGHLTNQSLARRERKATSFADALTAMDRYEDLPYKIWRRTSDDVEMMTRLMDEWSAAGMAVKFHLAWLEVDTPVVGAAYRLLYETVRPSRITNRNTAWNSSPRRQGSDLAADPPLVSPDSRVAKELCLSAMRNELRPTALVWRRRLRVCISHAWVQIRK